MKVLKFAVGVVAGVILIKIALTLLRLVFGLVASLIYVALVVGIIAFIGYFIYRLIAGNQKQAT